MKGHIRERSPGSFEIRYSWKEGGRRRTATATVRGTRKDAQKELRRRLTALDENRHVDPTRMIVGEWLEMWLASIRAEVSPKTLERYGELTRHYLIPELGGLLQKLTSVNIYEMDHRRSPRRPPRHRAVVLPAYAVEELRRLKHLQAEELLLLGCGRLGRP
jgi:Phage integrase, N-terminal SAM-like domain